MLTNRSGKCLQYNCTPTLLKWPLSLGVLVLGLMLIRDAAAAPEAAENGGQWGAVISGSHALSDSLRKDRARLNKLSLQ